MNSSQNRNESSFMNIIFSFLRMNKKLIFIKQESILALLGVKPYNLKIPFLNSERLSFPFNINCFRI